ncbi:tail fiber protein [Symbiopectobacterium sp.]|uniref:phage tail protein n=1 Tax=Symbiopectobacterium sp. TaxID=2952789 RepID=UPI003F3DC6DF
MGAAKMSYLKESPAWEDGIYQIETSDPVLGGPEGITNRPPRELANRTAWLKQQLEGTQAALEAHANSRNHPDATLAAKGFVQLSNATYSQDETTAATPKLVNDRVNAIVDNAPSDLDTLNKLAQAISNNPKFAESVTQLLSQKLAKNENGADIPDKNQFLKNLGLLETINLAKNATPNHRKVNGKPLTQDVQLTATDVHAITPEILRVEIPVGVPLPWPTEKPPAGWRICNGESFDKKQCPLLALAYPSGKLPDLRGEFIRGWDAGRKVDTGRNILSAQGDAIRNITGRIGYARQGWGAPPVLADGAFKIDKKHNAAVHGGESDDWGAVSSFNASRVVPTANENRPRNIAFNYIVRAA